MSPPPIAAFVQDRRLPARLPDTGRVALAIAASIVAMGGRAASARGSGRCASTRPTRGSSA
jgi:hypothetical protein